MPIFDVYLLLPGAVWFGVEADSEEEAIAQCADTEPRLRAALDPGEPYQWVAVRHEGDEELEHSDAPEGETDEDLGQRQGENLSGPDQRG